MRKVKYPEIGKRLREARKNAGLKQKECLVPLGDITPQMLSDWENGYVCPSIIYLKNLSKFYNVSLDYIILGCQKDEKDKEIHSYKDAVIYISELINSGLFEISGGYYTSDKYQTSLYTHDENIGEFKQEYDNLLAVQKTLKPELFKQAMNDLIEKYDLPLLGRK